MPFSKRSELSPNMLRMPGAVTGGGGAGGGGGTMENLLLCYKNRRGRGLWQKQVKTFQATSTKVK